MVKNVVEVSDIVKTYKMSEEVQVHALRGISFKIKIRGSCVHHGSLRVGQIYSHEYHRVLR
jgi:hypothetical protein